MNENEKEILLRKIKKIKRFLKNLKAEVEKEPFSCSSAHFFSEIKSEVIALGASFELLSDFDFPKIELENQDWIKNLETN